MKISSNHVFLALQLNYETRVLRRGFKHKKIKKHKQTRKINQSKTASRFSIEDATRRILLDFKLENKYAGFPG